MHHGHLIAFEGLDQSGKQTQAERLRDRLVALGRQVHLVSFPDYTTHIGTELARALAGERDYNAEVMQLLYVANRYERKDWIASRLRDGADVISDRYLASSVAYGQAFGLDPDWLTSVQRFLPQPAVTILLDVAPETAAARKRADRDRYERDLALQGRVRGHYLALAAREDWLLLDGQRSRDLVAADVFTGVAARLGLP